MKRKEFIQNSILLSGGLFMGVRNWEAANSSSSAEKPSAGNRNYILSPLHIEGSKIINAQKKEVFLRGANIGGWMLMEDFINGFPGLEHSLRLRMTQWFPGEPYIQNVEKQNIYTFKTNVAC